MKLQLSNILGIACAGINLLSFGVYWLLGPNISYDARMWLGWIPMLISAPASLLLTFLGPLPEYLFIPMLIAVGYVQWYLIGVLLSLVFGPIDWNRQASSK